MFTNPNTLWIEILVIALTVAFLATIIGRATVKLKAYQPVNVLVVIKARKSS